MKNLRLLIIGNPNASDTGWEIVGFCTRWSGNRYICKGREMTKKQIEESYNWPVKFVEISDEMDLVARNSKIAVI